MRDQQKFKYETEYGSPFVVEGVGLDVGVCCHPALPSPRGVAPVPAAKGRSPTSQSLASRTNSAVVGVDLSHRQH